MKRALLALVATAMAYGFTTWVAVTMPRSDEKVLAVLALVLVCFVATLGLAAAISEVRD